MVATCYRCKQPGHKAMFCHFNDCPNDAFPDSGVQAYQQLPFNTTRWHTLKAYRSETLSALEEAESFDERKDILDDFMADVFASAWRYCCLKVNHGSTSHKATEPNTVSKTTTATATTDSDSDGDHSDDGNDQSTDTGCSEQDEPYQPVGRLSGRGGPQPDVDSSDTGDFVGTMYIASIH